MKEPLEVVLQHGWAWGAGCWSSWRRIVPQAARLAPLDRGYFKRPGRGGGAARPQILVAHSLGLHLLPPHLFSTTELLVVLGGFQAFHAEEEPAARRSRQMVRRMLRRLDHEPEALLEDFYTRCFSPSPRRLEVPGDLDTGLLRKDLEMLHRDKLDLQPMDSIPRILLMHGGCDRVVPLQRGEELHRRLQRSSLIVVEDAGHALPLTHALECWRAIERAWAETRRDNGMRKGLP